MANFTISLAGSAVVSGSKTWTLPDADVQKLVTFLIAKYSPVAGIPNAQPLTNQQALLAWVQDFVNGTVADVKTYQQSQAAVQPVAFT